MDKAGYKKKILKLLNGGGFIVLEKVDTKEIEKIKERLKAELEDKNLPSQRKEEVESLIIHLDTWLEWRAYKERKRCREQLESES